MNISDICDLDLLYKEEQKELSKWFDSCDYYHLLDIEKHIDEIFYRCENILNNLKDE